MSGRPLWRDFRLYVVRSFRWSRYLKCHCRWTTSVWPIARNNGRLAEQHSKLGSFESATVYATKMLEALVAALKATRFSHVPLTDLSYRGGISLKISRWIIVICLVFIYYGYIMNGEGMEVSLTIAISNLLTQSVTPFVHFKTKLRIGTACFFN